ncbi:MAG: ChaN family lipoprotein [Candidatus Cloacimonetes bacterium]|nr:ChaN family lipoprotein [Candidatus Cloacimonadota bacterium]
MKILFIVMVLIFFTKLFSIPIQLVNNGKQYQIYDSSTQKEIDLDELVEKISEFDITFFGEFHDDAILHVLEVEILPLLLDIDKNLSISMEMFERDIQKYLTQYLKGSISEKEFLENSRPWPNYQDDYKPIIEFAKEHKIDVIAANVPRRYASMVNKKGSQAFENIPDDEKQFVASELKVLDNAYKKTFIKTMQSLSKSKMAPHMAKMKDNIYAAQCLKDDTMAESMYNYLKKNPKKKIIHYNGDFHSNSHLGTAQKLQLLNKKLKICVITPIEWEENTEFVFPEDRNSEGDFLISVIRPKDEGEIKMEKKIEMKMKGKMNK